MNDPAATLCLIAGQKPIQRPGVQYFRRNARREEAGMSKGQQQGNRKEASTPTVPKPRSRVITGWRQVAPLPKGPRRKKPLAPVPPVKVGAD
jgi:hypothetical protein